MNQSQLDKAKELELTKEQGITALENISDFILNTAERLQRNASTHSCTKSLEHFMELCLEEVRDFSNSLNKKLLFFYNNELNNL